MEYDCWTLPTPLTEAHAVDFDYRGGAGVDFEPYPDFLDATETAEWWLASTGNGELDGSEFRVFGQDGTGGNAAFWVVRRGEPLEQQPVVFLGSEGETGVVAQNLWAYLWLLADGFGPWSDGNTTPLSPGRSRLTESRRWGRHIAAAGEVSPQSGKSPGFEEMMTRDADSSARTCRRSPSGRRRPAYCCTSLLYGPNPGHGGPDQYRKLPMLLSKRAAPCRDYSASV